MKLKHNSFKTVLKLFWHCFFISVSFQLCGQFNCFKSQPSVCYDRVNFHTNLRVLPSPRFRAGNSLISSAFSDVTPALAQAYNFRQKARIGKLFNFQNPYYRIKNPISTKTCTVVAGSRSHIHDTPALWPSCVGCSEKATTLTKIFIKTSFVRYAIALYREGRICNLCLLLLAEFLLYVLTEVAI